MTSNFYRSVAARQTCLSRSIPEIHKHVAEKASSHCLKVKVSASSVGDPESSHTWYIINVMPHCLLSQVPGILGSELELVGLVPVLHD